MSNDMGLPSKINSIMNRLKIEYKRENNQTLYNIVNNASVYVREGVEYDNWNGGTVGHGIVFFLPLSIIEKISLDDQDGLCEKIKQHMDICTKTFENEFIAYVTFELNNEDDPEFQKSMSQFRLQTIDPDTLSIWNKKQIRLFISHRDNQKSGAKELGEHLYNFGVSSFVAHDTIEPMTTWQDEIIKGLLTMEVMLLYIDDGFYESIWTNQEVGYALGRGIPIIPIKMNKCDPKGFILKDIQAFKGNVQDSSALAEDIYRYISKVCGNKERLREAIIFTFINSSDYNEARDRFDIMNKSIEELSESDAQLIIKGFHDNSQLHNAGYLTNIYNRLLNFLARCTNQKYQISSNDRRIIQRIDAVPSLDDDIPF